MPVAGKVEDAARPGEGVRLDQVRAEEDRIRDRGAAPHADRAGFELDGEGFGIRGVFVTCQATTDSSFTSTFWLGKNHNVPEQDVAEGGDRKTWPLGQGFERYYGFIGGETNQWYPDLVEDNHYIEPLPYRSRATTFPRISLIRQSR